MRTLIRSTLAWMCGRLSSAPDARSSPQDPGRRLIIIGGSLLFAAHALALPDLAQAADRGDEKRWVGTWTASPQAPEPPFVGTLNFDNQTIRQIVHTSIGGKTVRVRFSNEFGTTPLTIGAARIALQATGAAVVPGSDRALTFGGLPSTLVPAGAPMLSDPIDFDVPPLTNLVVTMYLPKPTAGRSFHSLGVQTTYVSPAGDYSGATVMPVANTTTSWFFLTGVTVKAAKRSAAIVTLGDSITDGYASTVDANRRWPNVLAARLQARPEFRHLAVLNHGISGNRTLNDFIGPNALARFDRDVLTAPGVKYVIVLEGINNIGLPGAFGRSDEAVTAEQIINGHRQLIARAKEKGLKIFGATLTPFEGTTFPGYFTEEGEAKRQAVNHWIRTSGEFDGVIDFDRVVRDPNNPRRILPAYDCGDHLHPNDAGYAAMGNAIELALFKGEDE